MLLDTEFPTRTSSDCTAAAPTPRACDRADRISWYVPVKVILDFVCVLILLSLSLPILLLAALLVKLTSCGPVLYSQTRLGLGGRPFRIYKIRSMYHDCEKVSGIRWSTRGDPRVTPVGWFLRLTHIDELPQLWNVLRGEMSLIGPRPERPEFVPQLQKALPRYQERLRVRPGLTGLAQVQLPADSDLDSVRRKLAHDLYYVERMGFWLDGRILFSTIFHVLHLPFGWTRLFVPGGAAVEAHYNRTRPGTAALPLLSVEAAQEATPPPPEPQPV
jgi:lipopolysaccharide/colanic/teichoic acid biosynthesis glycosyltransferase